MKKTYFILIALLFITGVLNAQFKEDALRYAQPLDGLGARALSMGNAYIGVSDDYTSVWYNPAGLAQIKRFELTGGLSLFNYSSDSKIFGATNNYSNNSTSLNDLGFVYPFPTLRGSLVFAVGYNRTNLFTTGYSYSGFNAFSSIVPSLIRSNNDYNIPYWLYFTDDNGQNTPISGNVNQSSQMMEGGSNGNWAFSGAIDVAQNLSVGLSVLVFTGSYSYDRTFIEQDVNDVYKAWDPTFKTTDYKSLSLDENITSEFSGIGANIGLMYKLQDFARFGLTIKTPQTFSIKEDWYTKGIGVHDFADSKGIDTYQKRIDGTNQYDVVTPWIFGFGASYTKFGLLITGEAELVDYSQLKFDDASDDLTSINKEIKNTFKSVANIKAGIEYNIPTTELRVRAGYSIYPSAYKNDPSDFNKKFISFGLGYIIEDNMQIDVGYSMGSYKTIHTNYYVNDNYYSETDETIKTSNILISFSLLF